MVLFVHVFWVGSGLMLTLARGLYLISLIRWGVSKLVVFVFLLFFSLLALCTSCILFRCIFFGFLNTIAFTYQKKKEKKRKEKYLWGQKVTYKRLKT